MTSIAAGFRRQLAIVVSQPNYWLTLLTTPLLAVVFLAIVRSAGRDDLLGAAVLAPALAAMWTMALLVAGEAISRDRDYGLLEVSLAAPASYKLVTFGRICAVTALSMLGFVESWLVALALFQVAIPVPHLAEFAAGLLVTGFAMAGASLLMSALFVRSTSVLRFQIALSYPFFVLGGIMTPVELLPDWVQPFTRVVFLSWSSDLLRDALAAPPIDGAWLRIGVIVALGTAGLAGALLLVDRMIDVVRRNGEVAFT